MDGGAVACWRCIGIACGAGGVYVYVYLSSCTDDASRTRRSTDAGAARRPKKGEGRALANAEPLPEELAHATPPTAAAGSRIGPFFLSLRSGSRSPCRRTPTCRCPTPPAASKLLLAARTRPIHPDPQLTAKLLHCHFRGFHASETPPRSRISVPNHSRRASPQLPSP